MDANSLIWQQPKVIRWSQILANSYQQLLGRKLLNTANTPQALAQALFNAPFVVVSHDTQTDPIFNYGNQTALQLWSITWDEFIQIPSRLSAETENRATRSAMLEQAATKGYIDNYQGVRISTTGNRFAIQQAIIWNLSDESGQKCGQAATFSDWVWLSRVTSNE
jgi:hypothetical protein